MERRVKYANEDTETRKMYSQIKDIEETTSIDRVNELIKEGWMLLRAFHNEHPELQITFVMANKL